MAFSVAISEAFTYMHAFLRTFPNLTLLPTDFEVAFQAANLHALTTVAMPNALIVATALLAGCEAIVTNDGQWKTAMSRLFANFLWLYLSDLL